MNTFTKETASLFLQFVRGRTKLRNGLSALRVLGGNPGCTSLIRLSDVAFPVSVESYDINVDSGRSSGVQRSQRLCLKCNTGLPCDEYHLVFECQALHQLRADYSHLFSGQADTMRQFLWQTDIKAVMLLVRKALACLLS